MFVMTVGVAICMDSMTCAAITNKRGDNLARHPGNCGDSTIICGVVGEWRGVIWQA